ncbi:MAG: ribonuclease HII [Oscillospiraceae bacterium]|nr:ribonuclease HII [Oscillospiraceae bacterium]
MKEKKTADWSIERTYYERGVTHLCGVDEAGAGPLMGPVCAAAVILPPYVEIEGLNDSKQLTEKKRDLLYDRIISCAVSWAVAFATHEEIDNINILNARMLAMERAITALSPAAEFALIDGNRSRGITCPNETVVGGDARSMSIAAASVLAKVTRDRYVCDVLALQYPQYQFEKHKGYGTKLHYAMLDQYGPCEVHRKTFLKKWEARR